MRPSAVAIRLSRGPSKLARDLPLDGAAGRPVEQVDMSGGLVVEMTAAFAAHPRFRAYVTRHEGQVVSTAGLFINGESAQFLGAAKLPPHRGRGGRTAMVRARVGDARPAAV
ncbi:hypothetical protein [Herbidospora cretacea]|uniref:hypothetical protein n=1 Tax=Herbidospora cretacea TaxID=28444 RepID=UPI0004C383B2|nr:hypothetical protein [Herbidospora cretacea]